jgi:hypothetical protein
VAGRGVALQEFASARSYLSRLRRCLMHQLAPVAQGEDRNPRVRCRDPDDPLFGSSLGWPPMSIYRSSATSRGHDVSLGMVAEELNRAVFEVDRPMCELTITVRAIKA